MSEQAGSSVVYLNPAMCKRGKGKKKDSISEQRLFAVYMQGAQHCSVKLKLFPLPLKFPCDTHQDISQKTRGTTCMTKDFLVVCLVLLLLPTHKKDR